MAIVAPSILSADFANLERELNSVAASGAPWIHVDIMDGQFVPNISVGIPIVKAVRRVSELTLDVHLMITQPLRFVDAFCDAGADVLTVHYEADTPENIEKALRAIRTRGVRAGLSVKPATSVQVLEPYLELCDLILIMTVEPGFGGQKLIPSTLDKLRALRPLLAVRNPSCLLEVDGGVGRRTSPLCKAAGAQVLVSGTGFFAAPNRRDYVALLGAEL